MQGARAGDSGIYKCKPNNAPEAQIKVHILIGGKYSKLDKPLPLVRLTRTLNIIISNNDYLFRRMRQCFMQFQMADKSIISELLCI